MTLKLEQTKSLQRAISLGNTRPPPLPPKHRTLSTTFDTTVRVSKDAVHIQTRRDLMTHNSMTTTPQLRKKSQFYSKSSGAFVLFLFIHLMSFGINYYNNILSRRDSRTILVRRINRQTSFRVPFNELMCLLIIFPLPNYKHKNTVVKITIYSVKKQKICYFCK